MSADQPSGPAAPAPDAPPAIHSRRCADARAALANGRAADAAEAARGALAALPGGIEGHRLLGLALLELQDSRPALTAFQKALEGDPLDLVAQVGVAEAREAIAGAPAAEPEWLRAWELDPGRPEIERRLMAARSAAGRPALTRAALARIYIRGRLYEHAVAETRTLLSRDSSRVDLQVLLAEAHWRAGEVEAAAGVAGSLLERLPDCAAANLLLAAHWQAIGKDYAGLLDRVAAVDPAGDIAARLFDDRDPPPLIEPGAATTRWSREGASSGAWEAVAPPGEPAPAAPAQPVPAGPAPAAAAAVAPQAAREAGAPTEPEWRGGPVAAAAGAAHVEPEALGLGQPAASLTRLPERPWRPNQTGAIAPAPATGGRPDASKAAPVEALPEPSPLVTELVPLAGPATPAPAAPEAVLEPPAVRPVPAPLAAALPEVTEAAPTAGTDRAGAAAARDRGDAAMRAGDFLAAARAYGEALRELRSQRTQGTRG